MPIKMSDTAQRPFRGDGCSSEPTDLRLWDTYATRAGGKCKCKEKMIPTGLPGGSMVNLKI